MLKLLFFPLKVYIAIVLLGWIFFFR